MRTDPVSVSFSRDTVHAPVTVRWSPCAAPWHNRSNALKGKGSWQVATHFSETELYPAARLGETATAAAEAGIGALLLTPGPDLRYVTGYDAQQLERLTCLVVPAAGRGQGPFMVVPRLELAAAQASPAGRLDLEFVPWGELEDPYRLISARLGGP